MQLLTRKFTVEQYQKMGEVGILSPEERVELIEGEILRMSPIGLPHAAAINRLNRFFSVQLNERTVVAVQNSIRLNHYSEPQPDLVLLRPRDDFYENKFPEAEDVLLLIEVADSSLNYDQGIKMPLYAANQIPEFWLVNLNQRVLEVYREPRDQTYQQQQRIYPNQSIVPLAFPDLRVSVAVILG